MFSVAHQTTAPLSVTATRGYACDIHEVLLVTAVGLTILKAVSGAAARRISLPFIQRSRLDKLGLAVLTAVGWRGMGRDNASFMASDILVLTVDSQSDVPSSFIRRCRNWMTMHD